MARIGALLAAAAAAALLTSAAHAAEPRVTRYVDAHVHLDAKTPEDQVARFRQSGIGAIVVMWPDAAMVQATAAGAPGYVVPFVSLSAISKTVLTDQTAAEFAKLRDEAGFCGFGELATRLSPSQTATDAEAISDPRRMKIYDAANAKATPVNMHVSMADPATLAAIEKIVASHPRTPFIFAHAGLTAGPETLGPLMAAHRNVYADLSGRLTQGPVGGAPPPQSVLAPDGALKPDWRTLIERFPDRFMFATDINSAENVKTIPDRLAAARTAFADLPRSVEEGFAHGNIERVLNECGGLPRR